MAWIHLKSFDFALARNLYQGSKEDITEGLKAWVERRKVGNRTHSTSSNIDLRHR